MYDKNKSQGTKDFSVVIKLYAWCLNHNMLELIEQLLSKHLHMLYMDQQTKNVFTPWPMATFYSACKFSNYSARAKFYLRVQIVGSHKCKDKICEGWLNVQETSCFTSPVINEKDIR